ncbi:hypothetical protein FQR65_LT08364 [Abscondita terminalis]|nr:hypothetical protein FQR65_LT08364 [Abscondita terminalis]
MNTLIHLVTVLLFLSSAFADNLLITTTKGAVRGSTIKSATGKAVDAWYGIPYAEKPIGDRRFKPPLPANSWEGIFETTSLPNACMQTIDTAFGEFSGANMWVANTPVSEDCLYLNVVVPKPRPQNATVMVWIYGGGFYSGSSALNIYDHKTLVSEENVIVVSMQYRVASLGFLYFGNADVPGNVGFLDQVMALRWVQENIAAFGGNPKDVTIFGESAGAGSVAHHLLNPLSDNLFKRGIMQSGTILAPWALQNQITAIERGLLLAKELGCPHDIETLSKTISCLKKANANEMVYAEQKIPLNGIVDFPFLPVEDGEVIVQPLIKLAQKHFKQKDVMVGANDDEGYYFLMYYFPHIFRNEENITITYEDFVSVIRNSRNDKTELEIEAIIYEYTNWVNLNDSEKNRNALDKVIGDQFFTCSTNDFADAYAESDNSVYVYHYMQKSDKHYWPKWSGTLHADEVAFVFGEPMVKDRGYSREEVQFSKRLMKYWSNFAKTGNPNKPSDISRCNWPAYKLNKRTYINLEANRCSTGVGGLRPKQCAFWRKFLPKLKDRKGDFQVNQSTGEKNCLSD